MVGFVDEDLFHFTPADGAFVFLFGRNGLRRAEHLVEKREGACHAGSLQQQLHLSSVEPDPPAVSAVVQLDILMLDDYRVVPADRANHRILSKNYFPLLSLGED